MNSTPDSRVGPKPDKLVVAFADLKRMGVAKHWSQLSTLAMLEQMVALLRAAGERDEGDETPTSRKWKL